MTALFLVLLSQAWILEFTTWMGSMETEIHLGQEAVAVPGSPTGPRGTFLGPPPISR